MAASDSESDDDLIAACQKGDVDLVSVFSLVSAHHPDEDRDASGATALWNAAFKGHAHCIELLISAKGGRADVNLARDDSTTPLYIACQGGHTRAVQILLAAGAQVDVPVDVLEPRVQTPLRIAAECGHIGCVDLLLVHGARPDGLAQDGYPPLKYAAQNGHTCCVERLLKAGADVNLGIDCSPLAKACHMGQAKCAQLLVDAGADIELLSATGVTALFLATFTACAGHAPGDPCAADLPPYLAHLVSDEDCRPPDNDKMDVPGAVACVELLLAAAQSWTQALPAFAWPWRWLSPLPTLPLTWRQENEPPNASRSSEA